MSKFAHNQAVFAKYGAKDPWWPSKVIDRSQVPQLVASQLKLDSRSELVPVWFFGSGTWGAVKESNICDYKENVEKFSDGKASKKLAAAFEAANHHLLYPDEPPREEIMGVGEERDNANHESNESSSDHDEDEDDDGITPVIRRKEDGEANEDELTRKPRREIKRPSKLLNSESEDEKPKRKRKEKEVENGAAAKKISRKKKDDDADVDFEANHGEESKKARVADIPDPASEKSGKRFLELVSQLQESVAETEKATNAMQRILNDSSRKPRLSDLKSSNIIAIVDDLKKHPDQALANNALNAKKRWREACKPQTNAVPEKKSEEIRTNFLDKKENVKITSLPPPPPLAPVVAIPEENSQQSSQQQNSQQSSQQQNSQQQNSQQQNSQQQNSQQQNSQQQNSQQQNSQQQNSQQQNSQQQNSQQQNSQQQNSQQQNSQQQNSQQQNSQQSETSQSHLEPNRTILSRLTGNERRDFFRNKISAELKAGGPIPEGIDASMIAAAIEEEVFCKYQNVNKDYHVLSSAILAKIGPNREKLVSKQIDPKSFVESNE